MIFMKLIREDQDIVSEAEDAYYDAGVLNLSPDQIQILDIVNKIEACMESVVINIQSGLSSKMVDVFRSELFD